MGLLIGTLIAIQSQIFTSPQCLFTREVYDASTAGAATNIIQGFSVGYFASIIPSILIAILLVFEYRQSGIYGIAIASVGMCSTLPLTLNVILTATVLDCSLCLSRQTTLNNQALFMKPDFQAARAE